MSLVISQRGDGWALVDVPAGTDILTVTSSTGAIAINGDITFASGTDLILTAGNVTLTNGNLVLGAAGKGLQIKSGSNAKIGTTAAMTAGAVTVSNTSITANSIILYNRKTTGGPAGHVSYTISAGTSFTLTSTSNTETSTFDYMIVEKG
jgi:hypothetical protein